MAGRTSLPLPTPSLSEAAKAYDIADKAQEGKVVIVF